MKKLLLATVAVIALSAPAWADSIIMTAKVDGVTVAIDTSADGNLNVPSASFGGAFNINSLSINTETFLAVPDLLSTNTLNVNQSVGGNHQLVIDIVGIGLAGPNAIEALLSSFSVTGLTAGWSAQEQTFINGTLLADTGVFTATSDSAFSVNNAVVSGLFNAEAIYTINSVGIGRFNGGIDISAAETPLPAAFWLFGTALGGGGLLLRRRQKKQALAIA
jgi:hypothetical protein